MADLTQIGTKVVPEVVEPIKIALISGTGDGGASLPSGVLAKTPDGQPNIKVSAVIGPIFAILIRFINQFLTTLVGLVGAGMTPAGGKLLGATDFYHLVLTCAVLSVAGAGFGFLKDLVTVFGKLEGKYPLLTGSI